jgi:hypothetical protein
MFSIDAHTVCDTAVYSYLSTKKKKSSIGRKGSRLSMAV